MVQFCICLNKYVQVSVRGRAELIHIEGRSTMCEYIKYTREHEHRQVFTPLQKDTCVIATQTDFPCLQTQTRTYPHIQINVIRVRGCSFSTATAK